MTSSMLGGERRWASTSTRRSGLTVIGKVAVPKPLNLPSQRYLVPAEIFLVHFTEVHGFPLKFVFSLCCLKVRKSWSGPQCGNCSQGYP